MNLTSRINAVGDREMPRLLSGGVVSFMHGARGVKGRRTRKEFKQNLYLLTKGAIAHPLGPRGLIIEDQAVFRRIRTEETLFVLKSPI